MATNKPYDAPEIVGEIRKKLEAAMPSHGNFVRRVERGYSAYRGVLKSSSDAAKWRHKLHPPYAFNLLETVVSNTIEQGLRFKTTPAPQLSSMGVDEAMGMVHQAEIIEQLIRHEHRIDGMDQKQRPLFLEAAIAGRGIGKCYWNLTEGSVKRQGVQEVEHYDDMGNYLGSMPTITEITEQKTLRDHSTFEVIDSRDFIVHESAQNLQPWTPGGAQHLFHRGWFSYEQLKTLEQSGYLKNVDYFSEEMTRDYSDDYSDREKNLYDVARTKNLIEVIEYWCYKNGSVYRTIIGNRAIVLRDEEDSPFWHGGYPFIVCSMQPQNFTLNGVSEVELIEQLQEILWELMNQRLDNVELINNAIMLVNQDMDTENLQYFPGAHWPVEGKDDVVALQPPYQIAEISLSAEAQIKGDLQNVTSAAPFAGGAETATVDQKTATGASIVMNAAQKRMATKKYQGQFGLTDEAWMRLKNCQQFIEDKRLVHVVGEDGVPTFHEVSVLQIQGEFNFELEPMSESQIRQEKRAEATQITQVLLQALPMGAATNEPLSFRQLITYFLKQWGVEYADMFFTNKPEAAGAAALGGPPGQPAGAPGVQGQANMGTTAKTAVDAASPSATGGLSMSGQTMMQRAQALSRGGGPRNA